MSQPLLGRCKECDYALFVGDDNLIARADEGFKSVKADGRAYHVDRDVFGRCPNRHKVFLLKRIKGTYSKDHKCDSRCLNAKGHDCTCSCGGANHGRGHAIQIVEASAAPVEMVYPATEKQENFIRKLLDERLIPDKLDDDGLTILVPRLVRRELALEKLDRHEFTKRQASATIEWLLSLPENTSNGNQMASEGGPA